jgi:hypothetical protein
MYYKNMTLSLEFTKEDLLNKFHSQDLPIIIYGAGAYSGPT